MMFAAALAFQAITRAQAAQTDPDWQNASVVERNRLPMRATFHTDNPRMSLHGLL